MKWFSQRKGLKKVRTEIQINSIDDALRNRLWNIFLALYLTPMAKQLGFRFDQMQTFVILFWDSYLKLPLNSAPYDSSSIWSGLNKHFFECNWAEVYDFLVSVVIYHPDTEQNKKFSEMCNGVLEEELSAYRLVGMHITQITSEEEISEIEEALENPLQGVKTHLAEALKLLSDRKNPDYRNSIKESISAVETICKLITGNKKTDLGKALKVLEPRIGLHGALKQAFNNLYAYTSDAEGIRHALMDEPNLGFEDAKFMLVICSAFVNYLTSKAKKAKIELQ